MRGWVWFWLMLGLVVAAFVVPFALLSGVDAWYGSFLFWTVFAVVVFVAVWWMTRVWEDRVDDSDGE